MYTIYLPQWCLGFLICSVLGIDNNTVVP